MHVILQAALQNRHSNATSNVKQSLKKAGFKKELIVHNVVNLRRLIKKLQLKQSRSTWSNYINEHSYSNRDIEDKKSFVRNITSSNKYDIVWDLGCNTGTFSKLAAENTEYVIAIDYDPLTINHLYLSLKNTSSTNILPLVGNLADPSPNIGWRNLERKPLQKRGKPDLIMALALIHHLVIGANIPLDEAIHWFAELGGDLLIEYIDKNDLMTQKLLANKDDHYSDYTQTNLERLLAQHFNRIDKKPLESGTRILYFAQHT
jgi:SAM-dependent methyltransferase